ncbi:hypothetical protein PENSPDRAFT_601362 [Peniophora sp. CONT]|nr:hypothetical protein PENSPDRAFT_601362 [Peniophora sp. CONT]
MGFLKRFLSLGSRKGKKRRNQLTSASTPGLNDVQQPTRNDRRKEEREQEDAARRLLRSSSAHFTVVSEIDYSSLPPLPHPINSLTPTPTGASTYSLTPTASPSRSTVQSRGRTYTVKVLGREVHTRSTTSESKQQLVTPSRDSSGSRTNEYPAITPHDEKRIHRLRQDPSVASLLDMYDTHGQLDSAVFSNSPDKRQSTSTSEKRLSRSEKRASRVEKRLSRQQCQAEEVDDVGRAQIQRSGSTLRQLLGSPEPEHGDHERTSSNEGDISWAERFLGERASDNDSSPSDVESPLIETPKDAAYRLPADLIKEAGNATHADINMTISTEANSTMNASAFNSLEVEYSQTSDDVKAELGLPVRPSTPATPARPASEVFGFLLERRKSKSSAATLLHSTQEPEERALPPLPTGSSAWTATTVYNNALAVPEQPSPTHSQANTSMSTDAPSSAGSILDDPPTRAMIVTQARAPTPVLLQQAQRAVEVRQSRIPRGPRAQSSHSRSRSSVSIIASNVDTHSTGTSTSTTQSFATAQSFNSMQPPPTPATEPKTFIDEFKTPVKGSTRIPTGPRDALRSGAGNAMTPRAPEQSKMPFGLSQSQGHPKTPKAAIGLGLGHGQPLDRDAYTPVPARRGNRERRIASAASARSVDSTQSKRSRIPRKSKENALDFASVAPAEKLRSENARPRTPDAATLFAGAIDADRSAELSPVTQRMMADLRERRKPVRATGQMAEFVSAAPRE